MGFQEDMPPLNDLSEKRQIARKFFFLYVSFTGCKPRLYNYNVFAFKEGLNMSLVSVSTYKNKPILCGDILFSQSSFKRSISIPTIDKTDTLLPTDEEKTIVTLVQKLVILRENFCLGWVGNYDEAKDICIALRDELPEGGLSLKAIEFILSTFDVSRERSVRLLLLLYIDSDFKFLLWNSEAHDELEPITPPFAIGSGKNHFNILNEAQSESMETDSDYFAKAINESNLIHSYELAFGENIKDLWGGFIQAIIHDGVQFKFIDNFLTFFIGIQGEDSGNLSGSFFPYAFRPLLLDDLYVIERFHISPENKKPDYFGIPNILNYNSKVGIHSVPSTNFKPTYYSISSMFINKHNKPNPMCLTFPEENSTGCIDCNIDGNISFYIYPNFLKSIFKIIANTPALHKQ